MQARHQLLRPVTALVVLLGCLSLLGCGFLIPVSEGTKVAPKSVYEFAPGTTTQEDVRTLLGEPDTADARQWTYSRRDIWVGVFSTVEASFFFDEGGMLQEFDYKRLKGILLPLLMGKRIDRARVTDFRPGEDTLDDVFDLLGEPDMMEGSLEERGLAFIYLSGFRTTSALFEASASGTITSVTHIDSPYRMSLLSGKMEVGSRLPADRVLALVPGHTTWRQMVKRLGQPTVLVMEAGRRDWVYLHTTIKLKQPSDVQKGWLLVNLDGDERLSRVIWATDEVYSEKDRPDFHVDVSELIADELATKTDCRERLGVPSGLVRDAETDQWVYVTGSEERVDTLILTFSPQGELIEHESRRDFNWTEDAAKRLLPKQVGLTQASPVPSP